MIIKFVLYVYYQPDTDYFFIFLILVLNSRNQNLFSNFTHKKKMLKKICRDTPIIGPCEKKYLMTPLPHTKK